MLNEKEIENLEESIGSQDSEVSQADRELAEKLYDVFETEKKLTEYFVNSDFCETEAEAEGWAKDVIAIATGKNDK